MQGSNGLEKQNGNTSQTNDVSEDLRDFSPFYTRSQNIQDNACDHIFETQDFCIMK